VYYISQKQTNKNKQTKTNKQTNRKQTNKNKQTNKQTNKKPYSKRLLQNVHKQQQQQGEIISFLF
jgi:hypothetical protein